MASGYPDWLRAFSMLGKHGTDYVVVAVTEEGNLYTLLQGETVEGVLQTVRLDSEGRMSAFVIDSVDAWGKMLSIGNAELAVRLGSSVLYEQSGRVQFIETFGQGLGLWGQVLEGAGAAIAIDPVYSRHCGYSVKLTGGNTADHYAEITYEQGIAPVGATGIAFAFSTPTPFNEITMKVFLWDTTTRYSVGLKIDGVNENVHVLDQDDLWQEVLSVVSRTDYGRLFFFAKFTFDPAEALYKELRFNQHVVDISAYELAAEPLPAIPKIRLRLRFTSRDDENDYAYFDDIILTTGEP